MLGKGDLVGWGVLVLGRSCGTQRNAIKCELLGIRDNNPRIF